MPAPGHCLFTSLFCNIGDAIITFPAPPDRIFSPSQRAFSAFILSTSASFLPVIHSPAKVSRPLSISNS